jgi:hypothetical protein
MPAFCALLLGTMLPGARGANLLANPSFEQNSGHTIPTAWTRFAPPTAQPAGNYWIEGNVTPHSGLLYYKEWGASYNNTNNVAGIYQDFSGVAGSTYQAGGWLFTRGNDIIGPDCAAWLEVSFLGATSNLLALFKSENFNSTQPSDTWLQYPITNACDIASPVSLGDPFFTTYAVTGAVTQLVAPLGTKTVRFRFAYMQSLNQGGSCYVDDLVLNQVSGPVPPVIGSLSPLNMIFVNPGDGLNFNVSSPSGFTINSGNIGVVINGVNVSSNLVITGSSSNKTVAYQGLQSNLIYNASITVTDAFNLTATANTYFETTWVGVPPVLYFWEAEDFDFNNGMYINHPQLCDTAGNPNCYFGKVGFEGTDEHSSGSAPNHVYRPDDPIGTLICGDYLRKDHVTAGVFDYRIDPFNFGSWLNYTRDWSNGTYWVIGRLSTDVGLSGSLTLSVVNPDTSTTDLGTFTISSGHGWSTFDNVYLKDTNGNNALVTLQGTTTLRLTSGGNLLPGFFMLVAAQADLPQLSNLYPSGAHPFEYANALSFTVTSFGSSFPANGINVNMDGNDVSSALTITGTTSSKNVVYPALQPNAIHTAIISVTNSLGHGIRVTNHFDTFSQDNYMVEAEDFDTGGGQFVDPWSPDSYATAGAVTNVDYQHIPLSGEAYPYRSEGIPEDISHDYLRQIFIDYGALDYSLTFFAGTDWANYTRAYPPGTYYVYGRFSGGGPFSMYLDQVVSGAGTTSQTTKRLGHWSAIGKDYVTYDWVPLTDDGLAAPAVVKLNGVSTLRITTDGFCNPNYFMLVPAAGIRLTARPAGSNVALSFPTQVGANYRVFYKTNLTTATWTLLNSGPGNGGTKTVNDPASALGRFYKVTSP